MCNTKLILLKYTNCSVSLEVQMYYYIKSLKHLWYSCKKVYDWIMLDLECNNTRLDYVKFRI